MNDNLFANDIIRLLGPGKGALTSTSSTPRAELTNQLQKYMHTLGPTPKRCLETFADLGLSDSEIGRYFRIPYEVVTQLREVWGIDDAV